MLKRPLIYFAIALLVAFLVAAFFSISYLVNKLEERNASHLLLRKADVSITIVEGKRREEIAAELERLNICTATAFLAATTDDEGYLFPDTYRFFPGTSAPDVVTTLKKNFDRRTADLSLTPQAVILASIVEREAQNDDERAIIAGVYTNRLNKGMRLEADPTVQYAKDTLNFNKSGHATTFSFWGTITRADYSSVQSTYNTYSIDGLPPGPIANPGLPSLKAALSPAQHQYYFFFHRNGQLYLSKTLAEQQSKLQSIAR
jgi:UPF0755 protein